MIQPRRGHVDPVGFFYGLGRKIIEGPHTLVRPCPGGRERCDDPQYTQCAHDFFFVSVRIPRAEAGFYIECGPGVVFRSIVRFYATYEPLKSVEARHPCQAPGAPHRAFAAFAKGDFRIYLIAATAR